MTDCPYKPICPELSLFTLWNPPQEGRRWRHSTGQVQHRSASSNGTFTPPTRPSSPDAKGYGQRCPQ